MAAIYLIRHGQASFGKADYDQLSDNGIKQSKILGKHWKLRSVPCKTYSGDLLRHGQTLEYFMESFQNEQIPVVLHSGFNELDHCDVIQSFKPQWEDLYALKAYVDKQENPEKALIKEFNLSLEHWVENSDCDKYKETWSQFKERCIRALQDVIAQELENKRRVNKSEEVNDILIFTSSGTISVIIQHIMELSDKQTLMIIQQMRNTGVTKLLFSDKKLSIDYINNYSHLELAAPDSVTLI